MATDEPVTSRSLFSEMFISSVYKHTQGRMVRQVTCLTIWVAVALASWRFFEVVIKDVPFQRWCEQFSLPIWVADLFRYGLPLVLLAAGVWFGFRLVNWPRFADFLIAVEAELNKVSWPSRSELVKASLVVIFTMLFLASLLFCYDLIWQAIFTWLKIS